MVTAGIRGEGKADRTLVCASTAEGASLVSDRPRCSFDPRKPSCLTPLPPRLKELDRITRWVFDDDLRATRSRDDLVGAEWHSRGPQPLDLGLEVIDLEENAVPTAGHLTPASCAVVALLAAFHRASAVTSARRALGCQPPATRCRSYR